MKKLRNISIIIASVAAIVALPLIGRLTTGVPMPQDFFKFPPITPPVVDGWSWLVFIIVAAVCFGVTLVYIFPSLFRFKKTDTELPSGQTHKFPVWFWIGLVMWLVPIVFLWAHTPRPKLLQDYSDFPLFWGFTLLLDGCVFKRQGHSMLSKYPTEIMGIATASVSGWMLYEYLNLFVNRMWYYPFGNNLIKSPGNNDEVFLMYSILGSTGLMPMAFEWYDLILTIPSLRHRFDAGVKITMPAWLKIVLLLLAFAGLYGMGYAPGKYFFYIFLLPLVVVSVVLSLLKVWTPFTPVMQGNWTPVLVFGLAYLAQGFVMEGWNCFSATHYSPGNPATCYSPAFWEYKLPYVDGYRIFEMPVVGFWGYIPFSIYCWVWWIMFAYVLGIKTRYFDHTETYKEAEY
jgi:hypothetical protein